ncbi:hypothetical protein BDY19DRAFT_971529 [Irpex rosettiformis]|uniref:Uncharacterized protein n=1 Tax=Irpex rosettiformis TaxID=378272 RepID=A0ACB8TQS3_9APHY|nr:hypothetical protein BDY19DRAFT_971529 [Irpex rosettiformis]
MASSALHAPAVTHDNIFFYYGVNRSSSFYVKVESRGIFHQHSRADPLHLYGLLTYEAPTGPLLTKKGAVAKRQPGPHKDQSEHFYCAQLLHYGLKPLKTKGPAKKALLAAFGSGKTLTVPAHILQLQEQLRIEYEAANASAKQKYEDECKERRKAQEKAQEQRRVEARKKFNEVLLLGEALHENLPTGKKSGTAKGKAKETTIASKKVSADNKKLQHIDIAGHFDVQAPALSEEWPDMCRGDLTLRMSPSKETGRHLWASFDFGIITGVMRCSKPPRHIGELCTFTWHGEESSEGQMMYDNAQKGSITFLGNGNFKGVIEGGFFGKAQFVGTRNEEASYNRVWCMYVKQWKATYRSINASAYDVAAASRWGGWVEDTSHPDHPLGSDTSGAGGKPSHSDYGSDDGESEGDDGEPPFDGKKLLPHQWPKQTARKSTGSSSIRPSEVHSAEQSPPRKRTKQTARRGGSSGSKIASRALTQNATSKTKEVKLEDQDMSGIFDIKAPDLDQWSGQEYSLDDYGPNRTIKLLSSTNRLWGSFNFGVVAGIIRCSSTPHFVDDTCTFTWRGKESGGEGELTFGEVNVGTLTFLGDGKIEGVIKGSFFGRMTFSAAKKNELKEWKRRFRCINFAAHAAAGRARWGGWSGEQRSHYEGPADSDTSDGGDDDASRSEASFEESNMDVDGDLFF